MEKEVTSRMNRVMELIVSDHCKTLKDVADLLNISMRQVRYDISRINEELAIDDGLPIIETDNKGIIIINDEHRLKDFSMIQEMAFKCTKEQRLNFLYYVIAFNIPMLKLNRLAKQLNVSRSTVKNDIEDVKKRLNLLGLSLKYTNHFELSGPDKAVFEYRMQVLQMMEYTLFKVKLEKIEYLLLEYTKNSFKAARLLNIIPILSTFIKNNNLFIRDQEFYWLLSNIVLILWYADRDYKIPENKYYHLPFLQLNYDELIDDLKNALNSEIDVSVKNKICSVLSAACYENTSESEIFDWQLIDFIFQLIIKFPKSYQDIFMKDKDLIANLLKHLYRCKQKIDIPFANEVVDNYESVLKDEIKDIIKNDCLKNHLGIELSHKIDYKMIELYFVHSLYQYRKRFKKKVLLVSGGGTITSRNDLKTALESLFEIEVADVITKYEIPFFENWTAIEAVLFTESIPLYFNSDIPIAKINMILDSSDFLTLKKMNILPHSNHLNLNDLYSKLGFLNSDVKTKTIKVLDDFLQKHIVFTKEFQKDSVFYDVKTVENIHTDNYFWKNKTAIIVTCKANYNRIELMKNKSIGKVVIRISCNDALALLKLLFISYKVTQSSDIMSLCDSELEALFV